MAKAYLYDLTDTWDAAGTTFNAIKMNVTDTASAAASLLMDLQVGGSSRFSVRKDGLLSTAAKAYFASATITLGETGSGEVTVRSSGGFGWSPDALGVSTPDTILRRDAANTLAQRNGTSAQTFNIYNTYTDASNYERATHLWAGNIYAIRTQGAGTGVARAFEIYAGTGATLSLGANNTQAWRINTSGHFIAATDNTYDIGASGANRPRIGWFGTGLYVGSNGYLRWESRSFIDSPADGVIRLLDNALTSFNRLQFGGTTSAFPALGRNGATLRVLLADGSAFGPLEAGQIQGTGSVGARVLTPIPAGGTTGAGVLVSSTANFGVFFGSGAPTLSAAKGSIYLRSDGTTTNDRMYVNTDGATTWTAVTTAA